MKEIPLTQGKIALVDDEDFEKIKAHKWFALRAKGTNFYAARSVRKIERGTVNIIRIFMHREIMNPPDGLETDHKDGNGLNCQKDNLRICTRQENGRNRKKWKDTVSCFKGVYWKKDRKKWGAHIKFDGKTKHVGYFKEEENAAAAYDAEAKKLFGEFARGNFA